ncbi:MAG TPA: phosphonoacetate hydrolase [Candidatus Latescibacteria bacterium]|nr:phosphonoacetate hydrolase [Gemmatimonadaceae bacterium]MDP6016920.1 phosphonoacetate hydrolase [Candidatus Latescibacterota bacterium]HJP31264.1 phosphonoacetate hydrolase [Candidatus Latescibacterota bacterium]
MSPASDLTVNGRSYSIPQTPVVGICLDGCEPAYLDEAATVMPALQAMIAAGARGEAHGVVPSFTNPNNVAIITGAPPEVNGIPGNFYYDAEADEEVLMQEARWLRCPTLLAAFARKGVDVATVTTKDKLRAFLSQGLPSTAIRFSVEKAHEATLEINGIEAVSDMVGRDNPGIYDPEASVFCIEAGARLMTRTPAPRVLYLSTTDFVQHKHVPGTAVANTFYARLDLFLGELHRSGAVVGITADHGMNTKTKTDGSPKVEYLETRLRDSGVAEARVILPITDPYVVHHGALGSYATVYVDADHVQQATACLQAVDGVERVLTRDEAARTFQLPPDRIGDLVVLADRDTVLGRTPEWHDLKDVATGLRSHGGLHEATVPFIVNRPLADETAAQLAAGELRNFDLFHVLCNGLRES